MYYTIFFIFLHIATFRHCIKIDFATFLDAKILFLQLFRTKRGLSPPTKRGLSPLVSLFTGATDEERSLVCPTVSVPENTTDRDDGWRAFRVKGTLDFSLTGILARLSAVLAENKIGIFAISTFNTDYILTKSANFDRALAALRASGYEIDA